jgi:hypothetical protein
MVCEGTIPEIVHCGSRKNLPCLRCEACGHEWHCRKPVATGTLRKCRNPDCGHTSAVRSTERQFSKSHPGCFFSYFRPCLLDRSNTLGRQKVTEPTRTPYHPCRIASRSPRPLQRASRADFRLFIEESEPRVTLSCLVFRRYHTQLRSGFSVLIGDDEALCDNSLVSSRGCPLGAFRMAISVQRWPHIASSFQCLPHVGQSA